MPQARVIEHAFNADCRLPEKVPCVPSWETYSETLLIQHRIATLSTTRHTLYMLLEMHIQLSFGLMSPAGPPHAAAPKRATCMRRISSSCTIGMCHWRILAQFCTGSYWAGQHKKRDKIEGACQICTHTIARPLASLKINLTALTLMGRLLIPFVDEQHVIFDCPEYTYAMK